MKVQLLVPASIVVSVALLGIIKLREKDQDKEDKRSRFQDMKLRVTYDVLKEYQTEKSETQLLLDKTETSQKALDEEVEALQGAAHKARGDAEACRGAQKSTADEAAKVETDFNNLKAATNKETASWKAEVETLKQKLAAQSAVCGFVKKESDAASKLCGDKVAKNEQPKPEAPKPEEAKKDEPKAEAPKPEEAKKDEPKAEAPKPEEAKKDEPKAEAPKPEQPKAEAPKN